MQATRTMAVLFAIAVVAAAFGIYGFSRPPLVESTSAAETSYVRDTTTTYGNVTMTGTCTVTSYFLADTEAVLVTMLTKTSGNTTTVVEGPATYFPPKTETLGSTTYSTSTYTNDTVGLTTTHTSYDPNAMPSSRWFVTVCTYQHP